MKKVLFLFSYKKNKLADYDDLLNELRKTPARKYDPQRGALKELEFKILDNKPSIYEPLSGRDLADNDLVFFRMWLKEVERATASAIYLRSKGVKFFDEDVYSHRALSKLTETFMMATSGLPVPNTFFSRPERIVEKLKNNSDFKFPLIVKNIRGLKGEDNYLVKDHKELVKILEGNPEIDFMVQDFIPNDFDYRFWVLGDKVKLVIKRSRQDKGSHLNNISQGAQAELVDAESIEPSLLKEVVMASQIMKRNFTGVDVIVDNQTGKHYFLEVNNIPEVISVFVDEKMEVLNGYLNELLKGDKER